MKKHLQLLVLLLIMGSFSLNALAGQKMESFKDSPIYKLRFSPDGEMTQSSSTQATYSQPSSTLTTPIGQAGNLYTIIRNTSHMVAYNEDINSVLFMHRSDPTIGFLTTSDYSYDLSTDGGATWSSNLGPINTNPGADQPNGQARYPQTLIYNPAGNTDPNNALGVFAGATHDGVSCISADAVWDGISTGSPSLANPDASSHTDYLMETYPINGCTNNSLIPNSLTHGEDGEFWATDWVFGNEDYYEMILWKGTYSAFGGQVTWDYQFLDFPHDKTVDGTATAASHLIDFSPDGQMGWIMVIGDGGAVNCGLSPAYIPIYSRTMDGGDTWSAFQAVELQNFDGWLDADVDTVSFAFDQDLYVDGNGDPYLATAVGDGGDYNIAGGSGANDTLHTALLSFSNTDDQWKMIKLGFIDILRGEPALNPDFVNDQNFHISAIDDDVLLVTYLDHDSLDINYADNTTFCQFRDLKGQAYRISTNERSEIKDFTNGDPYWDGKAWFWTAAPEGINDNNTTYTAPGVFTDWPNGDLASVFFHYVQDVSFDASEINIPADVSVHTAAPPVVGIFNSTVSGVNFTATETGSTGEVCEVVFDWGDGTSTGALLQAASSTHLYPNIDATYTVCVSVINNDGFDSYCEDVDILSIVDTEAPVIQAAGAACGDTIQYSVFDLFSLPSSTALDNVDGDVTGNVIVNNSVPLNADNEVSDLGLYTIEYSASDLSSNVGTCVLYVQIIDDEGPEIEFGGTPDEWQIACEMFDETFVDQYFAEDNWDGTIDPSQITVTYVDVDDTVNGTYVFTYEATDAAGNTTIVERTIIIFGCAVGIEEASFANFIDLYPNPTSGMVNIRYDLNSTDSYDVTVYNVLGEMVHNAGSNELSGANQMTLDLSDQLEGIYFVRFENEEGIATKKITVSK